VPRKAKPGGMRVGAPGTAYPNRSDLSSQKSLPARAATGQTYGQAGQQLQAQQTVPMAPQPVPMPPPGGPGPALPTGPAPSPPPMGGPPPSPMPSPAPAGSLGPYNGPTERPNEPITAGAPFGAGPGPEALAPSPLMPTPGTGSMSSMLSAAAAATGSATLASLTQRAQAAGM
jgi:hypothetical protein